MELIIFVSVPSCNLIDMLVLILLYLEVVEAVANALVNCCSSSERDFECFVNNVTNPSSTISCEASFDKSENIETLSFNNLNNIWKEKLEKLGGKYLLWSNSPDNPQHN